MKIKNIFSWALALSFIPFGIGILASLINWNIIEGIKAFTISYLTMLLVPIGIKCEEKRVRNLTREKAAIYFGE